MAILLADYIADSSKRDSEHAKSESFKINQEWVNLDFLDSVWRITPTVKGWCDTILYDLLNCDFSGLSDESFWELYKYYLDEISKTIPVDSNLFREYIKRNNWWEWEQFMKDGILVFHPIDSIDFSRALFTKIEVL